MPENEDEKIREAMSIIGSRKSERKTQASRANLEKAWEAKGLKACTCNQEPHKAGCPVYNREAMRRSRANRKKGTEQ